MNIKKYLALTLTAVTLFLVSCEQESSEPTSPQRHPLEVMPMSVSFVDRQPWTRANFEDMLPRGYKPYNQLYPSTTPDHTTIGVFMTPEKTSTVGNFIYQGTDPATGRPSNDWKSTIAVLEGTQYFIYGFMPREDAESASISMLPSASDYSSGAVVQIHNYNTLTAADVCVIVGLRWASATEKINDELEGPVELGKFEYVGREQGDNRIFLLLEHIYAGLHFKASIDPNYHKLRDINIKKVRLTAADIHTRGDLTVTLEANNTNTDPVKSVSFVTNSTQPTDSATITLYDATGDGYRLEENMSASFLSCFAPRECSTFILETTYDVYDRNGTGNLIRKDCVTRNKINDPMLATLNRGDIYTVELKVMPTYLYVLSEPDLDNPTIVVE